MAPRYKHHGYFTAPGPVRGSHEQAYAWLEREPLPTYVRHALLGAGIWSIEQAYATTPAQYRAVRNLGKKGYALVQQWLQTLDPLRVQGEAATTMWRWYFPLEAA